MKNKYLINFSKKMWFWFWENLMNGFAPADSLGNYVRPKGIKINKNYIVNVDSKKLFLILGNSCPWSHRTLLVYKIKNLSNIVKIIFLEADINNGQWIFEKKFKECKTLNQLYRKAKKGSLFRSTAPLLINSDGNEIEIISNESSEICQLLNSFKNHPISKSMQIGDCNKNLLNLIHNDINDGVYKCGFARNQSAYELASKNLFIALKKVDLILKKQKSWICGEELTYADIFLFPTLIRWELIYSKLFNCTEKEISDFHYIIQWRLKFYKILNVAETCSDSEWKKDYFKALFPLNPNQIIPVLPSLKEIMQLGSK